MGWSHILNAAVTSAEAGDLNVTRVLPETLRCLIVSVKCIWKLSLMESKTFWQLLPTTTQVTVLKRIQMNAVVLMGAVSAPILAPCVNVTLASG